MNLELNNQIDNLKNVVRILLELANKNISSNYTIPRDVYEEVITRYPADTNYDDSHVSALKDKLYTYDDSNTDDKLRAIFNELDEIQARYIADSISSDSNEVVEDENKIEESINLFYQKGLKREDVKTISSLKEYVEFVHDLDFGYLSRGQENCEWALLPSALRTENDTRLYSDVDVCQMVEDFRKTLSYYDKTYNNQKNELEILAYAQHYSIPTNLIDFTESHLISLLFALENYSSKYNAIVYFVDAKKFNSSRCQKNEIPNCSDDQNNCEGGASSIFIKSDNINERIHFQKGYFLKIPANYDKEDAIIELKGFCKVVLIPSESKYDVLQDLFKLGLGFQSIYPDLDNMAKSIKFKYRMIHEV